MIRHQYRYIQNQFSLYQRNVAGSPSVPPVPRVSETSQHPFFQTSIGWHSLSEKCLIKCSNLLKQLKITGFSVILAHQDQNVFHDVNRISFHPGMICAYNFQNLRNWLAVDISLSLLTQNTLFAPLRLPKHTHPARSNNSSLILISFSLYLHPAR